MSIELVAFIRARLDEEERLRADARRWSDRDWTVHTGSDGRVTVMADDTDVIAWIEQDGEPCRGIATYIANNDPAHARARIDAQRKLVDSYAELLERGVGPGQGHEQLQGVIDGLEEAIKILATQWAKHPHWHKDYRAEWAPDA